MVTFFCWNWVHRNHPNWFANFKILIMSFIAMLPVFWSPFSAWSGRCLTFSSLVRHMYHLFQFLTQTLICIRHRQNTPACASCMYTLAYQSVLHWPWRISRDRLEQVASLLLVVQVNLMFGAIPILSGSNLCDFPIHFPELGNTHLHCDTAVWWRLAMVH